MASRTLPAQVGRVLPWFSTLAIGAYLAISQGGVIGTVGGVGVAVAVLRVAIGPRAWWHHIRTGELPIDPTYRGEGQRSVTLLDPGPRYIETIKALREVKSCDLVTAKNLVEGVPSVVASGLSDASAEAALARLQKAGASARVD